MAHPANRADGAFYGRAQGGGQAGGMLPPDGGGLIERAVFLQPHGGGLQIAEIIATLAALKRHVSAGVVFKVDKADLAVVAHDDVAGKGLA